jgi:hypothetical protein
MAYTCPHCGHQVLVPGDNVTILAGEGRGLTVEVITYHKDGYVRYRLPDGTEHWKSPNRYRLTGRARRGED